MGRPRAFDWEHARILYEQHKSYAVVGGLLGVTGQSVRMALNPSLRAKRSRVQRKLKPWRAPCLAGCGRMATSRGGRSGLCMRCSAATRASSVRDDELRCGHCRKWKPDKEFPRQRNRISRRGRHGVCRLCQPIVRRANRELNPERERAAWREQKRRLRERRKAA